MKWRKNMVLALVVSFTLGLGGCALLSPDELTEAQMRTWGIEYLEERYDREFEVTGFTRGGVFSNQLNGFYASTPDFPDRGKIRVSWSQGGIKGNFNDNFLCWPMSDVYQKQISVVVSELFPQNHISVNVYGAGYPSSFNSKTTFEEFSEWASEVAVIRTVVAIPSATTEGLDEGIALLEHKLHDFSKNGSLSFNALDQDNYQLWLSAYPGRVNEYNPDIERLYNKLQEWGDR